jgi:hypothetical protein
MSCVMRFAPLLFASALLCGAAPSAASAARPIAGGHYVVHTRQSLTNGLGFGAGVLHVFRHGDEFTDISGVAAEIPCGTGGTLGTDYFLSRLKKGGPLNRFNRYEPVKIHRDGSFYALRYGRDNHGSISDQIEIAGRFVTRRTIRGWFTIHYSICGPSLTLPFRANYSKRYWRQAVMTLEDPTVRGLLP